MNTKFRILGLVVCLLNAIYVVWLFGNFIGPLGLIFALAETAVISLTFLFVFNHWTQHHTTHTKKSAQGSLDVYLPIVNEPVEMFERTLKAATAIDYADKKIFVLDDGARPEIERLAQKYGVGYFARGDKLHRKAGNLNHAFQKTNGAFILALDADQVVYPSIAKDLLGYFADDAKLAIVTTRQQFDVPEKDFNHDFLFYEHMQAGKNADNAAISCGSGVIYRRSAIEHVGGFQTWNIVEDLYTSYTLHGEGFKTLYVNKPYSLGTAPVDLSTIYKQRGTWATDTLRMFFRRSPLFRRGLTLRQRLHYFEIGWCYVVSGLALPTLFFLPPICVFLNLYLVSDPAQYLWLRVPSWAGTIAFYYYLSDKTFSVCSYWVALFPVYFKAALLAILPVRFKYTVTRKFAGVGKRDIALVIPHVAIILLAVAAVVWRVMTVDHMLTTFTGINLMWIVLMVGWFAPVVRKGLLLE